MSKLIKFSCGVSVKNTIYASALYNNGLYRIDKQTGNAQLITEFMNSDLVDTELHSGSFLIKDRIYFIPQKADCINVYEINSNRQYTIRSDNEKFDCEYKGIVIGAKIYLIPIVHNRDILCLDTENDKIEVFLPYKKLKEIFLETGMTLTFIRIANYENKIILVQYGTNRVIAIDTSDSRQILYWDIDTGGLIGVFGGKKGMWGIEINSSKIHLLDIVNQNIMQTINWNASTQQILEIGWVAELGDCVYLFPSKGEVIYIINEDKTINAIDLSDKVLNKNIKTNRIINPIVEKDEIILLPLGINKLVRINRKEVTEIDVIEDNNDRLIKYAKGIVSKRKNEVFEEGAILDLAQFINGI